MNKTKIAVTVAAIVIAGSLLLRGQRTTEQHTIYLPLVNTPVETLRSEFGKHGIRFGFAVSSGSFENPITRAIIEKHAAIVTTEVALKMEYTQPKQGVFDFSEGDAIVAYAGGLGIGVHGHTVSWWGQNPIWLTEGTFTRLELEYILSNHVSTLTSHYKGRLISIDTANEAYAGSSGSLLCGPWCLLGEDYVRLSFNIDADYPVVYNSNFWNTQDPDHAIELLDSGQADGIGIQLHLSDDSIWENRLQRMDVLLARIRKHGGFARFSEVGVLVENDNKQAEIYGAIAALAIKHSDIVRDFVVWGVKDPAWRGNVTLFDRYGYPKPSYYALMNELR